MRNAAPRRMRRRRPPWRRIAGERGALQQQTDRHVGRARRVAGATSPGAGGRPRCARTDGRSSGARPARGGRPPYVPAGHRSIGDRQPPDAGRRGGGARRGCLRSIGTAAERRLRGPRTGPGRADGGRGDGRATPRVARSGVRCPACNRGDVPGRGGTAGRSAPRHGPAGPGAGPVGACRGCGTSRRAGRAVGGNTGADRWHP